MTELTNDNEISNRGSPRSEPDAHGQAALLLAESIIHMLVESGTWSKAEAHSVVQTAAEVKVEVAELAGESRVRMLESLALLARIETSLEIDAI